MHGPKQARLVPDSGQALTETERTAVLTLINIDEYADLSIGQIWRLELDEGRYLCSMSTGYGIARAAVQTRERRRHATHPVKIGPELLAQAHSRCVPWTSPNCAAEQRHLLPTVCADRIFSRYHSGWVVSTYQESSRPPTSSPTRSVAPARPRSARTPTQAPR